MRTPCLLAGLTFLGLSQAVAAKPPLPLPLAQDLPVEIVMNQQELGVDVPETAANVGVQFGLIGALIGSAIQNEQNKAGEARIVPLRDMLVEYAFNDRLEQALRARLPSEGISPNPQVTVLKTAWDAVDAQNSQHVPLHALVLVPRYAMDSDLGRMNVQLQAMLADREIRSDGRIKTRYSFVRNYAFHLPLVAEKGVDNSTRWQAMGNERMAALLDEGIAQTADILVYDLSPKGRAEWPMDGKAVDVTIRDKTLHGLPIRQTPTVAWVRTGGSRMQQVQGIEPVDEHDAPLAATATVAAPAAALPASEGQQPATAATADAATTTASAGAPAAAAPTDAPATTAGAAAPGAAPSPQASAPVQPAPADAAHPEQVLPHGH